MDRSLHTTLDAKAATFVGSDVALRVPAGQPLPPSVAARATEVQLHRQAWVEVPDRESVAVLAIDPATFADVAFWDATFADASLDEILDRLEAPSAPGVVPAVAVGIDLDGPVEAGIGEAEAQRVTIEAVAGVDAFPGTRRGKPTIYVAASSLEGLDIVGGRREAWIDGDRDDALAALRAAGVPFEEVRRASEIADRSSFVTVSWTFGFMRSLGLSAGLLALGGVAVHLDARRRDRVLGHAFLRRMGLSGRQHRRALLVELVASVLVGCWVGLLAALVEAWLAHGEIDPVPGLPPDPLLRPSVGAIAVSAVGSVVVVVVAAAVAHRRAERDDPVEVLRAGA
jgi:putative ABC transport system permease protein